MNKLRATLLCLAVAAAACAAASVQASAASSSELTESACALLFRTGASGPVSDGGKYQVERVRSPASCADAACWQTQPDANGDEVCTYAREALVNLYRAATPKRAKSFVHKQLKKGFHRQKIKHADAAVLLDDPTGAAVVLAVGRTVAIFTLNAKSNDQAGWPGAKNEAIEDAGAISEGLRRKGCPANSSKCL